MNKLKEFYEAISKLLTDKSELIVSKPTKGGDNLNFRVVGKKDIEDYIKVIAPTEQQVKEYYKKHSKDIEAMGEPEPLVYIPLIEDESIGFTLWGYSNIKEIPFDILLSQEYHLFCFHYNLPKERKTLDLFLNYRIENTNSKELYWYQYKMFMSKKLLEKSQKVKKVFAEFLIHPKREKLSEKLVKEFRKDDSVTIAYMLYVLNDKVSTKNQNDLYESMKAEFGFSFTKQSIFDKLRTLKPETINKTEKKKDIESVSNRISIIIKEL